MPIKYIMPDWDDYLDIDFDFQNDCFSSNDTGERNFAYLHEIMKNDTPYDGILVSLNQIEKKKGALKKHGIDGTNKTIREIMRVPERIKIIGDCGAFSYKDKEAPPISPEEAARFYNQYKFDMGASVDHMAVEEITKTDADGKKSTYKLSSIERDARVQTTINNAMAFIEAVNREGYSFIPLGSIQARTPQEYAKIFKEYIEMGYRQVALGSLIPKTDDEIREIINSVGKQYRALSDDIKAQVGIHLFGILRPSLFDIFSENGISSFDSASYFRKAWLKSDKNYLSTDGNWYAAIRVPQTELPRNKKALTNAGLDITKVSSLEKEILTALNGFKKDTPVDPLLDKIMQYDKYFERSSDNGEKLRVAYQKVLTDRPWEKCQCAICKKIGIHVLVFRGYNRNKRRGFHNTYVFYHNYNGGREYEHVTKEYQENCIF